MTDNHDSDLRMVICYVTHSKVAAYVALGWVPHYDCFTGTHHGAYSVLCEWPLEKGEPVFPEGGEKK